jgi:hypothetical protein
MLAATIVIAVFTVALSVVALLTRQTYEAMLSANKVVERAYVDLSHQSPPGLKFDPSQTGPDWTPSVNLNIKNHGKTPADISGVFLRLVVHDGPLPPQPPYDEAREKELRAVLMPNETVSVHWPCKPVPGSLFQSIQNDQKVVWVIGYVDYRDRFGARHRSGYARRYDRVSKGNNLIFEVKPDYNYDRLRTCGEGSDWHV